MMSQSNLDILFAASITTFILSWFIWMYLRSRAQDRVIEKATLEIRRLRDQNEHLLAENLRHASHRCNGPRFKDLY